MRKKLVLNKETLRNLNNGLLNAAVGGGTNVAACISAAYGSCTTWAYSDCGDCGSDACPTVCCIAQ